MEDWENGEEKKKTNKNDKTDSLYRHQENDLHTLQKKCFMIIKKTNDSLLNTTLVCEIMWSNFCIICPNEI